MADTSPPTTTTVREDTLKTLGSTLLKEASKEEPLPERCLDLIHSLEKETGTTTTATNSTTTSKKKKGKNSSSATPQSKMTKALLESSSIGTSLTKSIRYFKRHKRTSSDQSPSWNEVIQRSDALLSTWTSSAAAKQKSSLKASPSSLTASDLGEPNTLPKTVAQYRARLMKYKAELYKDPPVLPPSTIEIESKKVALPKRNTKTGELTFPPGTDETVNKLLKSDFHPNRTPQEVLEAGAFGGTYFRPIGSSVTNRYYKSADVIKDTLHKDWVVNVDGPKMLTSSAYRVGVNKYGVKCGGSLGMWESSGWISDCDPYGWFQWYCRFYQGRRSSDDQRQISRWMKSAGIKGRFRSQLCNKILAAQTTADDASISPVIRQTLLHWGLEVTPMVLERHKKRVKG